ncbi:MAG: hypothetical protein LBC61_03705, partial [Candidatus Peribacteria bacterium]|nr:hypothetical protein [Candidatus Peribacteria bacterium]
MIPLEETFKLSDEEFKEYVVDYSNFFICVLKQLGIMNYSEKKKEFKNPETLKAKEMLISKRIRNEFGCQNRVKTIYNRL